MTALVGVLCQDGVVIGSDSSATFGPHPQFHTIEQRVKKIGIVEDRVIVAGTGEVGLGQRFLENVRQQWSKGTFRQQQPIEIAKQFSRGGIDDFAVTHANKGCYGALVAFPQGQHFHLCEFSVQSFQPELKTTDMWFASMGSGQPITDPFLGLLKRVFWSQTQPLVNEGIFAVAWTLQHVIELNPGGINGPPQIAVLELLATGKDRNFRARLLDDAAMSEHLDNVAGAEKYLGKYKEILKGEGEPIPGPPADILLSPPPVK
jgi:Proteasome subunit